MEAITGWHSPRAARTSERCPACSAPIVGTKPAERPSARACRATCFIHSMVWMVSKGVEWRRLQACGFWSLHGPNPTGCPSEMLRVKSPSYLESGPRHRCLLAIVHDQIRGDRFHAELP